MMHTKWNYFKNKGCNRIPNDTSGSIVEYLIVVLLCKNDLKYTLTYIKQFFFHFLDRLSVLGHFPEQFYSSTGLFREQCTSSSRFTFYFPLSIDCCPTHTFHFFLSISRIDSCVFLLLKPSSFPTLFVRANSLR